MSIGHPLSPLIKGLEPANGHGPTFVVYDHTGTEIERLHYTTRGELCWRQVTFWSSLPTGDRICRQWTMNPDGTLRQRLEGVLDAEGRRLKSQVYYSAEGLVIDKQEYVYDEDWNIKTYRRWNAEGEVIEEIPGQ